MYPHFMDLFGQISRGNIGRMMINQRIEWVFPYTFGQTHLSLCRREVQSSKCQAGMLKGLAVPESSRKHVSPLGLPFKILIKHEQNIPTITYVNST